MITYFDTSSLLKFIIREIGSEETRNIWNLSNEKVCSHLTRTEMHSGPGGDATTGTGGMGGKGGMAGLIGSGGNGGPGLSLFTFSEASAAAPNILHPSSFAWFNSLGRFDVE